MKKQIIAIILLLVGINYAVQPQTNINSCSNLTAPNYYTLTQDITSNSNGDSCINITNSSVVFNLNGFKISNSNRTGAAGINIISGIENISVANGSINNSVSGIYATSSKHIEIRNITISDFRVSSGSEAAYGINLDNISLPSGAVSGEKNVIDNVTLYNGTGNGYGIYISGATTNLSISNATIFRTYTGYSDASASQNITVQNNFINDSDYGMTVSSSYSYFISNNITYSYTGLTVNGGFNSTISGNKMEKDYISFTANLGAVSRIKTHSIATNNTIDGKPIYYNGSCSGAQTIDSTLNAGVVYLLNCTSESSDIIIKDINTSFVGYGIVIYDTYSGNGGRINISNITMRDVQTGIQLRALTNNGQTSNIYIQNVTVGDQYYKGGSVGLDLNNINNTIIIAAQTTAKNFPIDIKVQSSSKANISATVVGTSNSIPSIVDSRQTSTRFYIPPSSVDSPTCDMGNQYGIQITNSQTINITNSDIGNIETAHYLTNCNNCLTENLVIHNATEGIIMLNSENNTISSSSISVRKSGSACHMTNYLQNGSSNISINVFSFSGTTISANMSGNLSINSSVAPASAPYANALGKYINISKLTQSEDATVNLSLYYDHNGYNEGTLRAYRYNGSGWTNISDIPGISLLQNTATHYLSIINLSNFSIFGLFAQFAPVIVSETTTPAKKPQLSLNVMISQNGDITVQTEPNARISMFYYGDGNAILFTENRYADSNGQTTFDSRGTGRYYFYGYRDGYQSSEQNLMAASTTLPKLSATAAVNCPQNNAVVTVSSEGNPVSDADVSIVGQSNPYGPVELGKTDARGNTFYEIIRAGDYRVNVSKEGYESFESDLISLELCPLELSVVWNLECPANLIQINISDKNGPVTGIQTKYGTETKTSDRFGAVTFSYVGVASTLEVSGSGYKNYSAQIVPKPCTANINETVEENKTETGQQQNGGKGQTTEQGSGGTPTTKTTTEQQNKNNVGANTELQGKNPIKNVADAIADIVNDEEKRKTTVIILLAVIGILIYQYVMVQQPKVKIK